MAEVNVQRRSGEESGGALAPRGMSPFALAQRMFDEMDRSFGRLVPWFGGRTEAGEAWWPSVEVLEKEGNLVVQADLPGVKKEDVQVEVTNGDLQIRGERKREREETGRGYYRSERSYGSFSRYIPLPEGAKTDEARAQFKDGVLEISIPVPESAKKGRQVPIETGEKK